MWSGSKNKTHNLGQSSLLEKGIKILDPKPFMWTQTK
jgi:hypothetical protein